MVLSHLFDTLTSSFELQRNLNFKKRVFLIIFIYPTSDINITINYTYFQL